ncbi:putative ribonuclease H-like domain-containing protein, partial [Tanacetum coccineum]
MLKVSKSEVSSKFSLTPYYLQTFSLWLLSESWYICSCRKICLLNTINSSLWWSSNSPGLSTRSFTAKTISEDIASKFSQTNRSGRKPTLSFMRPLGCPVTILNTLDHLGKFDGKADEGFFVGYSTNSKAFKIFDIDPLTKSMNYKPVVAGNQTNGNAGEEEKKDSKDPGNEDSKVASTKELRINQEKDANVNSTNNINTASDGNNTNNVNTDTLKKRDYDEVFAPVARIEAIRLFLAYASFKDFVVYQMDVKSAFLYGKIEEEVYVCQPLGFEDPEFPNKFYKIDKTLFIKRVKGNILLVQVYVDDIIFGSTKKGLCTKFEKLMHKKFQMSSMGEITFFLGLQVTQKNDGILISQDKYVDEILKKFGFSTVKTASTPIETSKPLVKDAEAKDVDVHLYRSMTGLLMYLTASRPDIMFVVCACAIFQVTPKVSHIYAVKRIFRYLKDRKSTTGGCLEWNGTTAKDEIQVSDVRVTYYWKAKRTIKISQSSGPVPLVSDETVIKEWEDRMEMAATTASSLEAEQDSGNINRSGGAPIQWPTLNESLTQGTAHVVGPRALVDKKKTVNGEVQIQDLVDKKKVIITETNITLMGYENLTQKLTFYKAFFSPQWKFLIHTILQCLNAKTTAWNEFSSTMTSAVICLATNQKFNFSKYIFDNMVKNLEGGVKFLMYPRFVQVFLDKQVEGLFKHKEIYVTPSHTKKVFANMKKQGKHFSGRETPLFLTMIVQAEEQKKQSRRKQRKDTEDPQLSGPTAPVTDDTENVASIPTHSNDPLLSGEDRLKLNELMELCTNLSQRVLDLETTKTVQALEIDSLKRRVKKLKKKQRSRTYRLRRLYKVGRSARVVSSEEEGLGDQEDASKQGRKILDIDADEDIT